MMDILILESPQYKYRCTELNCKIQIIYLIRLGKFKSFIQCTDHIKNNAVKWFLFVNYKNIYFRIPSVNIRHLYIVFPLVHSTPASRVFPRVCSGNLGGLQSALNEGAIWGTKLLVDYRASSSDHMWPPEI